MNQIQYTQDLKLNKQEFFILSNNSYRCCLRHPDNWIVSLSTDPNSHQFLQCAECFSDNPNQQTLHLAGLIKDNEKTVFKNFPIAGENNLYLKLKQVFEQDCSVDGLQNKISTFFLNLRKSIDQKINLKEEQMLSQAKSIWNFSDQVMAKYNQFAEKEYLKKIIYDYKDDSNKQNELFREVFTRISTNQNKYKEELYEKIYLFETQNSMINFDYAQKINQNIIQLIDSIDMFVIKNLDDLRIDYKKEQFELFQKKIGQLDKKEMTTSQLMAKLMSNKLNFCSKELIEQLQQIVFTLSNSIDRIDVKSFLSEDFLQIDLDKMNNEIIGMMIKQSKHFFNNDIEEIQNSENKDKLIKLISNKFNFCNQTFLQKLSDQFDIILPFINTLNFQDYLQHGKSSVDGQNISNQQLLQLSELVQSLETQNNQQNLPYKNQNEQEQLEKQNLIKFISLLENKTNFCSDQFITNSKNSIQKYSTIIQNLFLNIKIFSNNRDSNIDFTQFTTNQIHKLEKISNKITQLNKQFGESYYNSKSPIQNQQFNSYFLQNKIGRNQIFQQLLVDYPIFELADNIYQIDFIKTTYQDSQKLVLEKNNQFSYTVKQINSLKGQIATREKLDSNITYIFRCKINKTVNCNYIDFGIIKTQKIHNYVVQDENCCFETSSQKYGLDKILKGKNLSEVSRKIDYLEVRVNISKKMILFMDYPKYQNVNQVNEEKILQNVDYSFGIYFCRPGNDYVIEIESKLYDDTYNLLNFEVN